MALTAAQTQSVYLACGLHAEGGTRYHIIFLTNGFTLWGVDSTSSTWVYSDIKTIVDTQLASLSAGALAYLGGLISTFDSCLTSSFALKGGGDGIYINEETELEKAREVIVQIIGVKVKPVNIADAPDSRSGRVVV